MEKTIFTVSFLSVFPLLHCICLLFVFVLFPTCLRLPPLSLPMYTIRFSVLGISKTLSKKWKQNGKKIIIVILRRIFSNKMTKLNNLKEGCSKLNQTAITTVEKAGKNSCQQPGNLNSETKDS